MEVKSQEQPYFSVKAKLGPLFPTFNLTARPVTSNQIDYRVTCRNIGRLNKLSNQPTPWFAVLGAVSCPFLMIWFWA